jgi:hypothetical protein
MPEHLIRLRGGWLRLDPQAIPEAPAAGSARRVTLPMTWPIVPTGRARLARWFGLPTFDPVHEILALRLAHVGGLIAVQFNGREIARPSPGTTALEIPLNDPLPRRNLLVLDVDQTEARPESDPWGIVALIIAPRDSTSAPRLPSPRGNEDEELLGGVEGEE